MVNCAANVKAIYLSNINVELTATKIYSDIEFEQLFKAHYKALHAYSNMILKDTYVAEEVVQSMFLRFWEKRKLLNVQSSIKAYLYKCVYNDSLNVLKHEKIKTKYQHFTERTMNRYGDSAAVKIELTELQSKLSDALNDLPEQCRVVFQMSRYEELKYREIADKLGISIKTVENQMGKALRILRMSLVDFLVLLLIGMGSCSYLN